MLFGVAVAVLACAGSLLGAFAASAQSLPHRSTSATPDCAHEPPYPSSSPASVFGTSRNFPVVGGIDANGCDSWVYQLAPSFGPDQSFFAGAGFRVGVKAFQYGTQETTELKDGQQLIAVTNPRAQWLRVYKGFDDCTTASRDGTAKTTCLAPAVESRPADWVPFIAAAVILVLCLAFVVHALRPSGPVRRRRHFRRVHHGLAASLPPATPTQLDPGEIRQLQKRLRRLERSLSPVTSDSQHHWFRRLVASGRHGLALESLTRWAAESHIPVPDHLRDEMLWLAASLGIEHEVRPILEGQDVAHTTDLGPHPRIEGGFDVPADEFASMVREAVDSLPPALGKAMTNVAVVVDEENPNQPLYGLYQGHPLAAARYRTWALHPDKITIYRTTICEHCRSEEEVRALVYRVVVHEIAHHFGIDDPRLRELGW